MNNKEIILKIINDSILWNRIVSRIESVINLNYTSNISFEPNKVYNGYKTALDLLTINNGPLKENLMDLYVDIVFDSENDFTEPSKLAIIIYETWLEKIKDFYLKVA